MTLALPDDVQESIQRHIDGGRYSTPEDVLRVALARLDEVEGTLRDVERSIEDEKAGRVRSFRKFDEEFCKEHGYEAYQ
jgi:Arc/MetJ-type ribon-helix-helix transcriptional regulator